jgi:V/A-type H+-transporting ATPase subunit I
VVEQEKIGRLAAEVDSLALALGLGGRDPQCDVASVSGDLWAAIREEMTPLEKEVRALVKQRDNLEADLTALPRFEETLRRLVPLVPPMAHEQDRFSTILLVPRKHQWLMDSVRTTLNEKLGMQVVMVEENISETMRAMLIVAPSDLRHVIEGVIGQKDISQLQLPDELQGLPPDAAVARLHRRLGAVPDELKEVEARLDTLAATWGERLQMYRACLQDRLAEIRALDLLGMTEYTFVLQGWMPERDVAGVLPALSSAAGEAIAMETLPLEGEMLEKAPVALENVRPARPFERLVGIFSWPTGPDLDPTLLMALFMPFFFGIILGDIGYGAILLLLALGFLWRTHKPGAMRDIVKTLALGALWAIVFGFLYGEAFGNLGEEWGLQPIWIGRFEPDDVAVLLVFSIVVGALHIALGLLLGLWRALQERSRSHLLERGGMLICLVGMFLIVAALTEQLPAGFFSPALALVVIGIVVLGSSFGWLGILLGPLEFIGLMGNILSYLRLAAVGLASVYVALVANELAGGLGAVVVGVIVAVLIHTLNLALGAFSPTIHSMRLHYGEFFSKIYEGGGRPFKPFKSKLPSAAAE